MFGEVNVDTWNVWHGTLKWSWGSNSANLERLTEDMS